MTYGDSLYGSSYYGGSTMSDDDCFPQVHLCAMRIANLDPSGVPQPGAGQLLTIDSMVEIALTPSVTDGDEIKEKTGCGVVGVNYKGPDSLDRFDLKITVLDRNPYVGVALGRGSLLNDAGVHGYSVPALGPTSDDAVSIEFWSKRIDDGALAAPNPYAWWVIPKVTNLREDVITKNSGADKPVYIGRAFENVNWYDGPLNDWPVASDRAIQWFPTSALPAVACDPTTIPVS